MQTLEDTSRQESTISHGSDMAQIQSRDDIGRQPRQGNDFKENDKCNNCGRQHPKQKELCQAWGKTCKKCEGLNHFASFCLSDRNHKRQSKEQVRDLRQEVRRVGHDTASGDSDSKSGEQFVRKQNIEKVMMNKNKITSDGQIRRGKRCSNCGRAGIHRRKEDCEAYGKICWNYNKIDHLFFLKS